MLSYVLCMALLAAVGYGAAGVPGLVVGVVGFAVFDAAGAARRRQEARDADLARLVEHGARRR
jgi:hypothetical protein